MMSEADKLWSLGETYYRQENPDYEGAKTKYEQAIASEEHAESLFMLGWLQEHGQGVPVNLDNAKGYYERAAKQYHKPAKKQLILLEYPEVNTAKQWYELIGTYYKNQDYLGAIVCYEEAEELGYKNAQKQFLLGNYPKFETATEWYDLAKANPYSSWQKAYYEIAISKNEKHFMSLYHLGLLYSDEAVFFKDLTEAKKCFEQAAKLGHEKSKIKLFFLLHYDIKTVEDWYSLGESYQQNGNPFYTELCYIQAAMLGHEKAKQQLLVPYQAEVKTAEEWYDVGSYYYNLKEKEYANFLASLCFEQAINIKPSHVGALRALAWLFSGNVEGVEQNSLKAQQYQLLADYHQKSLKQEGHVNNEKYKLKQKEQEIKQEKQNIEQEKQRIKQEKLEQEKIRKELQQKMEEERLKQEKLEQERSEKEKLQQASGSSEGTSSSSLPASEPAPSPPPPPPPPLSSTSKATDNNNEKISPETLPKVTFAETLSKVTLKKLSEKEKTSSKKKDISPFEKAMIERNSRIAGKVKEAEEQETFTSEKKTDDNNNEWEDNSDKQKKVEEKNPASLDNNSQTNFPVSEGKQEDTEEKTMQPTPSQLPVKSVYGPGLFKNSVPPQDKTNVLKNVVDKTTTSKEEKKTDNNELKEDPDKQKKTEEISSSSPANNSQINSHIPGSKQEEDNTPSASQLLKNSVFGPSIKKSVPEGKSNVLRRPLPSSPSGKAPARPIVPSVPFNPNFKAEETYNQNKLRPTRGTGTGKIWEKENSESNSSAPQIEKNPVIVPEKINPQKDNLPLNYKQDNKSAIEDNNKVKNKLQLAIENNSIPTIKELVKKEGFSIDSCDEEGNTTVHLAVISVLEQVKSNKQVDDNIIQFLLSNGIDPHKKNNAGHSAIELAEKSNCLEVKEIFKQHQEGIEKMLQQAILANHWFAAKTIVDKYHISLQNLEKIIKLTLDHFVKNCDIRYHLYEIYAFLRNPESCAYTPNFFKQNIVSICSEWFEKNKKNISTQDSQRKDRLLLSKNLYQEIIIIAHIAQTLNPEDKIAKEITLMYQKQLLFYKNESKSEIKLG